MGEYRVSLVGESRTQDVVKDLALGEIVTLVHEPNNPHDDRAVSAQTAAGEKIGYLERDSWLGRIVINGKPDHFCEIAEITGGTRGKKSQGVILLVHTAKDAEPARQANAEISKSGCLGLAFVALIVPMATVWQTWA